MSRDPDRATAGAETADAKGSRRRRPLTRKGRPTLTKDHIAQAMLDLAGARGFRSVTMRLLAEHLGVTVRALYNYVEDRDEIVARAVALFIEQWPAPQPDPEQWERSIREYGAALRAVYRRHPRALLVSLDEQIDGSAIHPNRLTHTDAFLGMLRAIGLSVADAQFVHSDLTLRVFGFVLLVDYRQDQGEPVMEHTPVPPLWLRAHPALAVPHLREAVAAAPLMSVDEAFERVMDGLIVIVHNLLAPARHLSQS
ncbi:TetR/AcrR family transcriptional regulator [Nonomuraea sp. MG754425]|uniref:TetR/AcrR family transcriptional regulator n=1 Tax=Nonomuraea sp. MG754425 TaxID=2570319 RepID=UPI001F37AD5D|nr:TetR/AcrR family transcriptional regulator [Nonomuraea sp. MG754425]